MDAASLLTGQAPEDDETTKKVTELFEQVDADDTAKLLEIIDSDFSGNVNTTDATGRTPLMRATVLNRTQMVDALLEKKANIMAQDIEGQHALIYAISQKHDDLLQKFLSAGADADVPNKIGQTPLMKAVARGNADAIGLLLQAKVNANATTQVGKTALMQATEMNSVECAQILLEAGADPALSDKMGLNALCGAAYRSNAALVKLLLDNKADASSNGKVGTALTMAMDSSSVNEETLSLLVDNGCPLDAKNRDGDTALVLAVESNLEVGVKFLLNAKADQSILNADGKTALEVAKAKGREKLVGLLS